MQVAIIGGGTAGSEAAWRLRQSDKDIGISILEKSAYTQYSPCALPYVLAGEIKDFKDIFLFGKDHYAYNKINLLNNAAVKRIDRSKKTVEYKQDGLAAVLEYDRLIIAAGSRFEAPPIPGLDKTPYFTFRNIDDAKAVHERIKPGERALIIGAGYIGVELAHALRARGLEVTISEAQERIMPLSFDKEIAAKIQAAMAEAGVQVKTGSALSVLRPGKAETAAGGINFDHLFVCCGLKPDLALAQAAGLNCDQGIVVDGFGRTSDENIYAIGDAAESVNFTDKKIILSGLASTAVRQAKTAARNILGAKVKNEAALNASISRFGKLIFGSVGVTADYCREQGIKTVSAVYNGTSRAGYHPAARDLAVKIIADSSGRLTGCQLVGSEEIAGRLNMAALAIRQKMTLEEFVLTETAYNPAAAPIFDPLLVAAEICLKKLRT